MKKRVLAIMLACLMLVSLLPMGALAVESEPTCKGTKHYLSNCEATLVDKVPGKCGEYGYEVYSCNACGDYFADNFVKVDGDHDYVTTKAPTCDEAGEAKCSICDHVIELEQLEHDYEVVGEIVDCADVTLKCTLCGDEIRGEGHIWTEVPVILVKPDEKNLVDGLAQYTCTICDKTKEVVILHHECELGELVEGKAPTCSEEGVIAHRLCTICGNAWGEESGKVLETTVIAKIAHTEPKPVTMTGALTDVGYVWQELPANMSGMTVTFTFTGEAGEYVMLKLRDEDGNIEDMNGESVYGFNLGDMWGVDFGTEITVQIPVLEEGQYIGAFVMGGTLSYEYTYGPIVTPSNCVNPGTKTYNCAVCGELVVETLEPEHTWIILASAEPTCTTNGFEVKVCTYCHENKYVFKPATGHSTHEESEAAGAFEKMPATCEEDGYIKWYCVECGVLTGTEILEAVGCNKVVITKEATCSAYAYSYTICTNECHGQEWDKWYNTNVYTVDGETFQFDGNFDLTVDGEPVFILDLAYGWFAFVTVDVEGGFNDDITAHNREDMFNGIVNHPTCVEEGLSVYLCRDCEQYVVETLPATGEHDYVAHVTEPVCGNIGYTEYVCADCGDYYIADYVDALPLDYQFTSLEEADKVHGDLTYLGSYQEATCDSDRHGLKVYACSDCGKNVLVIDMTGGKHVMPAGLPAYEDNVIVNGKHIFAGVPGTCANPGYTAQYFCARCGEFVESKVEAPAHNLVTTVPAKEATCTTYGWTEGKECTVCDFEIRSETIPMLPHQWTDLELIDSREVTVLENGAGALFGYEHWGAVCEVCELTHEFIINYVDACVHEWNEEFDEEASKEPTCTEKGYLAFKCNLCGEYRYEELAMIDHKNEAGENLNDCGVETEDRFCVMCEEEIEVPAHVLDEGTYYAPTCKNYGYILWCCTKCDYYEVEQITENYAEHQWSFFTYVYENDETKDVIVGYVEKCLFCDETRMIDFDGVSFITEITNANGQNGITDGSLVKVTVSIAGVDDAVWGFMIDLTYSANMTFYKGEFVSENFSGDFFDKDGVVTIGANASGDITLNSKEAVIDLYFIVDQAAAGTVAVDVLVEDVLDYAGEAVDFICNDAEAETVALMDLNADGVINMTDVLAAYKLIGKYNVAADLDKDGDVDATDLANLYKHIVGKMGYEAVRELGIAK